MRVFNRTLESIVDENYVYARALSYLGIEFYQYPNKKLGELCTEKGLKRDMVIKSFYLFDRAHRFSFKELNRYPLEIVLEYLRHSHHLFIKEKLPYIAKLISEYNGHDDLRLIFPDFVEEFINHIYEEEDTLFKYINFLIEVEKGKYKNPTSEWLKFLNFSLAETHGHHIEDDEMAGIRELIDESKSENSIHWQVITNEIKAFDREMWYHAEIENNILFPKSLELESRIKSSFKTKSKLN